MVACGASWTGKQSHRQHTALSRYRHSPAVFCCPVFGTPLDCLTANGAVPHILTCCQTVLRKPALGQQMHVGESLLRSPTSSLQESRKNQLKDFVHIAGPLHVSHFLILTATEQAAYLRLAKVPRVSAPSCAQCNPVSVQHVHFGCMSAQLFAPHSTQLEIQRKKPDLVQHHLHCKLPPVPALHSSADPQAAASAVRECPTHDA